MLDPNSYLTSPRQSAWVLFVLLTGGVAPVTFSAAQASSLESGRVGTISISLEVTPSGANRVNPRVFIPKFPDFLPRRFADDLSSKGGFTFPVCIYGDGQESYTVQAAMTNESSQSLMTQAGESVAVKVLVGTNGQYAHETSIKTVAPEDCNSDTAVGIQVTLLGDRQLAPGSVLLGPLKLFLKAH